MIRRLLALSIAATALCFAGIAFAQEAEEAEPLEKGKAIYEAARPKCTMCHTETKNPLDNYGAAGTAEDAKAWVRTPKEMFTKTGKKGMMPAYSEKKISDEDLDALALYLMSLKQ
jgi:mono/diheme cytochrome c family protein